MCCVLSSVFVDPELSICLIHTVLIEPVVCSSLQSISRFICTRCAFLNNIVLVSRIVLRRMDDQEEEARVYLTLDVDSVDLVGMTDRSLSSFVALEYHRNPMLVRVLAFCLLLFLCSCSYVLVGALPFCLFIVFLFAVV